MFMLTSTHNALMAAKDARVADLQERLSQSVALTDRALDAAAAIAVRHDAFVALVAERTAPAPKPVPVPKRETDAVDTAIQWVAGDDKAKRRYLESWAKRERKAGKDVAAIAAAIMDGDRVPEDDDGIPA